MTPPVRAWLGDPYPLGATWCGNGVNFALYSEHAAGVDLCLFDTPEASQESARIRMIEQTDQVWHLFLPDARPGQLYAYRVYGPYEPERGLRFNASRLLIDPYAKALAGPVRWTDELHGYSVRSPLLDLEPDYRDNAWAVPKAVVIDPAFDWEGDRRPETPLAESIIYEVHVKGFSRQCTALPEEIRGSYAALGSPFAIDYFTKLGVTALELLPVHQHLDERPLVDRGLVNYWGYSTINFFSPDVKYACEGVRGEQVREFKTMVKNLHAAGIEVILDVVYNHTGEGNELGPTLSFRGIDNPSYYRLAPHQPRYYLDYTGCGNTMNVMHPRVLQLIMDSLRYWVEEMHVDGFRFDLASTLARETHAVSKLSAFFDIIHQDPVLSRVKLIAEPWDVGEGGYQVGNFPVLWAEWNGRYRDAVRRYWKGDEGHVREMAYRLAGSPDLYQSTGKRPYASINFITSHDGFTLNDLVSYNQKHNLANGEDNRDGENANASWNCGVEGPTDDPAINALRARQRRNFLATLFLSQGVPMLTAGDEYGRTQYGNNNAYCQDNPVSWLSWVRDTGRNRLQTFASRLIALRKAHPVFRRPKFFQGRRIRGRGVRDIMWLTPSGTAMTNEEWNYSFVRCLAMLLSGDAIDVRDRRGEPIHDDSFLLMLNAHYESVRFTLPGKKEVRWELVLDTALEDGFADPGRLLCSGEELTLVDRSFVLLRLQAGSQDSARSDSWQKRPGRR
ncbi:MAG TPA: glycogen debranching protein GlgX [Chthoniobacteraceae bacterium]|nr:glycogen debranching protein GlgX [Chthoniobacteraceae bacterium]